LFSIKHKPNEKKPKELLNNKFKSQKPLFIMPKSKLSESVSVAISFLSGMIFSNAIAAFLQGNYVVSFLSFAAIGVSLMMKKFVDWNIK